MPHNALEKDKRKRVNKFAYAGFDPARSPHLRNNPPRDLSKDVNPYTREFAAGLVSIPGDILDMGRDFRAFATGGREPRSTPISPDRIANKLGVDPESQNFQAGLIGLPGIEDAARVGGKKVLAALGQAGSSGGVMNAMTLFHGTPHKFDKFSSEAIGTGEGAQAYGHGLYFAEDAKVAGNYKAKLSPGRGGDPQDTAARIIDDLLDKKQSVKRSRSEAESVAIKELTSRKAGANNPEFSARMDAAIKSIEDGSYSGHLYEVDIPDDITDKMLDWDAPLSEQPESVRKALGLPSASEIQVVRSNRLIQISAGDRQANVTLGPNPRVLSTDGTLNRNAIDAKQGERVARKWITGQSQTGEQRYRLLAKEMQGDPAFTNQTPAFGESLKGSEAMVSAKLNEAGIPGIRFFDGSSRSAKEGTRNIVVFNPDDIKQVKRDGEEVFNALKK